MSASSSSIDIMDGSNEGPLVEVTLQSLSGLVCSHEAAPSITCAVGFAGSASDMQVSSSFLCGNTGNVVVESQAAVLEAEQTTSDAAARPLIVEWRERDRSSLSQSFSSNHTPHQQQQAHLTIRLPERDGTIQPIPFSKMNRDCHIVEQNSKAREEDPPSLDESETSSSQQQLHAVEEEMNIRGASVVWSASGAAMPDIIELHVSLILKDQTTHSLGIAYLVFFGSDIGTTVLDLPIKKQTDDTSNVNGISLQDDAFLRVSINVGQVKEKTSTPVLKESFLQDMQKLEPILQQIMAQDQQEQHEEIPEPQSRSFFCGSGDLSFRAILRTLSGVVKNCDDGEGVLHQTDSMGSTIVTTASHGI